MSALATPEGTKRFAERFAGRIGEGHFRERRGILLSSLGVGTYLGQPDAATGIVNQDGLVFFQSAHRHQ